MKDEGFIVIPMCPGVVLIDMGTEAGEAYPVETRAKLDPLRKTVTQSVKLQLEIIVERNGV